MQTDERLLAAAAVAMDHTAASAWTTAEAAAGATADRVILSQVQPRFVQDLEEVTKEIVKEQACQLVLDLVAPKPEEPGEGQEWTDLVDEVVKRMVQRQWQSPNDRWAGLVAWVDYIAGVAEDAQQLQQALVADSTPVNLFGRPAVQRAALAYARFCYAVPRLP